MADETATQSAGRARSDPTAELKTRARRRLIGAAALLLAVIVVVPAVLDPTPKPLPDAIPIEIPGEKTPFTPRLSLPPLPEPATVPPDKAAQEAPPSTDAKAEPKAEPKAAEKKAAEPKPAVPKTVDAKPANGKAAEAKRARDLLEGRADAVEKGSETNGKFVLQAAASSSETAAKELADRIAASGLKSYVEKFDGKDGVRFRVRVGPYRSREDAERGRARLRAIGVTSNLVAL